MALSIKNCGKHKKKELPPQQYNNSLLLKILHALVAGPRVTNLKRTGKRPPFWLALIMPESTIHTTKGKKTSMFFKQY